MELKISEHITIAEACKSQEAIRLGIDNKPDEVSLKNMILLAKKVFEPLRNHFNKPIGISSFFRSVEINKRIGGSLTSQHCKGEAIDIDADIFGGLTNSELFHWIKTNCKFDQLIWEFGDENQPSWVHVSYKEKGNRNQILKAEKINGTTKYSLWV